METQFRPKLSALQLNSITGNVQANIEKVKHLISQNIESDVDIIVLPEVWTVGWACEEFTQSAEHISESAVIKFLSEIAKKYNAHIIGGSFIRKDDDGKLYNSCPIFNRKGELVAIYDKNHLYSYCGCTEGSHITAGNSGLVINIDGVKTGISICYDIRFPEIYREYRKLEADLLINMAAWGISKPIPWETLTRARAIENQAFMVALTQSGKVDNKTTNIGHSRIFDYLGETVTEIKDQKEGFMTYTFSFDKMKEYRKECTILRDIKDKYEVKSI